MNSMVDPALREAIAKESARLMLRGTETQYAHARKRAAQWLRRGRIEPCNLPSDAEIESELYALARLFTDGSRDPRTILFDPPREEPLDDPHLDAGYHPDTFAALRILLQRLAKVMLDPTEHPEGDALYHSLQVYSLAGEECAYDEELLMAALLHEVGLGIDRRAPVPAALAALDGLVTPRTLFLIEHLSKAEEYLLTGRISRSIRKHEDFDQLLLLAQCDVRGRVPGAQVPTVDEALEELQDLGQSWDEEGDSRE